MIDKKDFVILNGNSVDVLKTLEDCSVDCCITSPPYYGLRDYGTGKWVGGDENCNHVRDNKVGSSNSTGHKGMAEVGSYAGDAIYKTVCPKCGAVRIDEQIGLEESPEEYIENLVKVFREVKRVLKDRGTLWVNIGDSYAGSGKGRNSDGSACAGMLQQTSRGTTEGILFKSNGGQAKPKDLIGIPWMLAFALRNDGWYLRQDIIWHKPNPMPESVTDRFTKSHEYIFLLSKSPQYYFDHESAMEVATGYDGRQDTFLKGSPKYTGVDYGQSEQSFASQGHERWKFRKVEVTEKSKYADGDAYGSLYAPNSIKQKGNTYVQSLKDGIPMRNKRDVWEIGVGNYKGAHFATYPIELVENCLLCGCPVGGTVLDPFSGSGTTGICAVANGRKYIGIELNKEYIELSNERFDEVFFRKEKIVQQSVADGFEKFDFGEQLND